MRKTGYETIITDTWGFYDIQDRIQHTSGDDDFILDLDIGIEVLKRMENNYDAAVGYTWDQVDYWYADVTKEK